MKVVGIPTGRFLSHDILHLLIKCEKFLHSHNVFSLPEAYTAISSRDFIEFNYNFQIEFILLSHIVFLFNIYILTGRQKQITLGKQEWQWPEK